MTTIKPPIFQTIKQSTTRLANLAKKAPGWLVRQFALLKTADEGLAVLMGLLLRLVGIILLVLALVVAWRITNAKGYVIAPISMPDMLVKSGFTGHVAALQLQDAIKTVKEEVQSVKEDALVLQTGEQETLDVSVMGFQVSIKSIAYHLGQLLGKKQKQIGGEIVQSGDKLRYTMRITDFPSASFENRIWNGDTGAAMDSLMRQAGLKLLEYTDPYRLAVIYYNQKDYDEALRIIRMIIAERPHERAWAYIAWGSTLQEQGNAGAAAEKFHMAIRQDSTNWLPYYRLSNLAFLAGDHAAAEQWLREVVHLNPTHTDALVTLGWRYTLAGRPEDADTSFYRAVRSAAPVRRHAVVWQNWIESKFMQNDQEAALAIAKMALEAAEEDADGYLIRGYSYIIQKDTLAAYDALEKAYQLAPGNIRAVISFAMANFQGTRDYEKVIAIEEGFIDPSLRHEGYANLLNVSAMACNRLGRHEDALVKIKRALAMAPKASQLYTTLAEYHAYMGEDDPFYANLETAFDEGFKPRQLSWDEEPYDRYKDNPRTAELLGRFKQQEAPRPK